MYEMLNWIIFNEHLYKHHFDKLLFFFLVTSSCQPYIHQHAKVIFLVVFPKTGAYKLQKLKKTEKYTPSTKSILYTNLIDWS